MSDVLTRIVNAVRDVVDPLNTVVDLALGTLSFKGADGKPHSQTFQFNPTELERSRAVTFTRTLTGNTLEEPGVGPRNQPKRKATRKPDPWTLTLSLRYDASYAPIPDTGHFDDQVKRIANAIRFFEALTEPGPFESENEKTANANETPPPPLASFHYGPRSWRCAVKNLRIKEEDFTHDLYPRRIEVTLTLEIVETVAPDGARRYGVLL
jgi:hypothetical protein